jgi:hemerythrin-like metal-binding protein
MPRRAPEPDEGCPMEWTDEMSVGIEVIDEEHRLLMDLLKRLRSAAEDFGNAATVGSVLAKLYQYSRDHFEHEEKILKASGYPDLEEHRKEHQKLKERLAKILNSESPSPTGSLLEDLVEFVESWFQDHLMTMDKRYQTWMAGRDPKS